MAREGRPMSTTRPPTVIDPDGVELSRQCERRPGIPRYILFRRAPHITLASQPG